MHASTLHTPKPILKFGMKHIQVSKSSVLKPFKQHQILRTSLFGLSFYHSYLWYYLKHKSSLLKRKEEKEKQFTTFLRSCNFIARNEGHREDQISKSAAGSKWQESTKSTWMAARFFCSWDGASWTKRSQLEWRGLLASRI